MKKRAGGWPRSSSSIFSRDPAKAIDWLCRAFGFSVRLKVEGEGGLIELSQLEFGEGLIMVGGAGEAYGEPEKPWRGRAESPDTLGGKKIQSLCVHVRDVARHIARAKVA